VFNRNKATEFVGQLLLPFLRIGGGTTVSFRTSQKRRSPHGKYYLWPYDLILIDRKRRKRRKG
jgi:hypothetical protein